MSYVPAPPPPPRRSHWFWWTSLALVIFCCGGCGIFWNAFQHPEQGNVRTAPTVSPSPTIGTPVRDGKFQFTVLGVECGVAKVGNALLNKTAKGTYCVVRLTVSNVKDSGGTYVADAQRLFTADGAENSPDNLATAYQNGKAGALASDLNPGASLTTSVVYDLPTTATVAAVELHDSPFSGGVRVALSR